MGGCEGAAGVGSRVQGNLGRGSYSVFEKILCYTISGIVFLSIEGHLEFCGASLENALSLPAIVLIFCYTTIPLLMLQKSSLSVSRSL